VETGEGIGLGNVDLTPALPNLYSLFKNASQTADITAVAAVRLSAAFPFVTPTPRLRSLGYHFADGGYYDNYGIGAAVAFLSEAYKIRETNLPRRLLLIEIRASRYHSRPDASPAGMLFQWRSPAGTILNVRDTAQRRRNDSTLELLVSSLAAKGVCLDRVAFELPQDDVPLSWHLTASQTAAIRRGWRHRYENSPEANAVTRFVSGEMVHVERVGSGTIDRNRH
jgi:hypothetical protein